MAKFADEDVEKRFNRQGHRCALCGKEIHWNSRGNKNKRGAWQAHHVDGNPENIVFTNCACLCINDPPNCHMEIGHWGFWGSEFIAPKSWYRLTGWDDEDLEILEGNRTIDNVINFHKTGKPKEVSWLNWLARLFGGK